MTSVARTNSRGYPRRIETPRYAGVVPARLTWAPPGYPDFAGFSTYHVSNTLNRQINLAPGENALLIWDEIINTLSPAGLSGVRVDGGRYVVVRGAHVNVPLRAAAVTLTVALAAADTVIHTSDASELAAAGSVRVRGDSWSYTAKSGNDLTGAVRSGSTLGSSPTHPIGSTVYPHEQARRGLFFAGQVDGCVHVEGYKLDGADASEGMQVYPNGTQTIVQYQNCQIGPLVLRDTVGATDNHPDVLQLLNGPRELRIDRVSGESVFQNILVKGIDGTRPTDVVDIRHSDFIGDIIPATGSPYGFTLIDDDDADIRLTNVWADPGPKRPDLKFSRYDLARLFREVQFGRPAQRFCTTAGIGYISPGYG